MYIKALLAIMVALTATTAVAAPTEIQPDAPVDITADLNVTSIEAQAPCRGSRIHWQGGGCEWNWGNACLQRCKNKAEEKRCCPGSVTMYEDDGGCWRGWETCECNCNQRR